MTRPLVAPRLTAATLPLVAMLGPYRSKAAATPASTGTCRSVVWEKSAVQISVGAG